MIKQKEMKTMGGSCLSPLSMAAHHPRVILCISPCLGFGCKCPFLLYQESGREGAILSQSLHHPSSIPCTFDSLEGNPSAILSADGPRKETTEKQRVTFERCSGICDQDDRMVS